MDPTEADLIAAVLKATPPASNRWSKNIPPSLFDRSAVRPARSEVEDIVQESGSRRFRSSRVFAGKAPFEHWLMRLAVRTCYDFLRGHQRNRETTFSELSAPETDWLDRFVHQPEAPARMPTQRAC